MKKTFGPEMVLGKKVAINPKNQNVFQRPNKLDADQPK